MYLSFYVAEVRALLERQLSLLGVYTQAVTHKLQLAWGFWTGFIHQVLTQTQKLSQP